MMVQMISFRLHSRFKIISSSSQKRGSSAGVIRQPNIRGAKVPAFAGMTIGKLTQRCRNMEFLFLIGLVFLINATIAAAQSQPFLHTERNRDAFARPAPALSPAELRIFSFGNRLFNTNWTVAPASAVGFDGLGPTFNRVSCSGCHTRDGRGRPPIDGETVFNSQLLRISIPGTDANGGPRPVPGYGTQINDRAIPGVLPEAGLSLRWQEAAGKYQDGTTFSLRKPIIKISDTAYGKLPTQILTSLRSAPAVFGTGLFDAVTDATLIALSDPDDHNQNGISGRVNEVYSLEHNAMKLGRFGWKAGVASLLEQNSDAAIGDIGISSRLHLAENCPDGQRACQSAVTGGNPELSDVFIDKLTQYVQMLGVPQAGEMTPARARGAALFNKFDCDGCHLDSLKTGPHKFSFLSEQSFSAYTDLLLHDMGPGLADGRPEFSATGSEWRTAPLWGLGLIETVNGHLLLLHDGRARGVAEAILWHDGEAKSAKTKFQSASTEDRAALEAFLLGL